MFLLALNVIFHSIWEKPWKKTSSNICNALLFFSLCFTSKLYWFVPYKLHTMAHRALYIMLSSGMQLKRSNDLFENKNQTNLMRHTDSLWMLIVTWKFSVSPNQPLNLNWNIHFVETLTKLNLSSYYAKRKTICSIQRRKITLPEEFAFQCICKKMHNDTSIKLIKQSI